MDFYLRIMKDSVKNRAFSVLFGNGITVIKAKLRESAVGQLWGRTQYNHFLINAENVLFLTPFFIADYFAQMQSKYRINVRALKDIDRLFAHSLYRALPYLPFPLDRTCTRGDCIISVCVFSFTGIRRNWIWQFALSVFDITVMTKWKARGLFLSRISTISDLPSVNN